MYDNKLWLLLLMGTDTGDCIMGRNYNQRRGRMEILRTGTNENQGILGYSIGTHNLKFEHIDSMELSDLVNRKLDDVEKRIQELD